MIWLDRLRLKFLEKKVARIQSKLEDYEYKRDIVDQRLNPYLPQVRVPTAMDVVLRKLYEEAVTDSLTPIC